MVELIDDQRWYGTTQKRLLEVFETRKKLALRVAPERRREWVIWWEAKVRPGAVANPQALGCTPCSCLGAVRVPIV